MLLCTKIKLEVGEQNAATLEFMQSKCRGVIQLVGYASERWREVEPLL